MTDPTLTAIRSWSPESPDLVPLVGRYYPELAPHVTALDRLWLETNIRPWTRCLVMWWRADGA
jgi:hypothetical protein